MKKLEDYLYYEEKDPDLKIYHGDCLDIMPLLPKVDLVVTDPPYGMDWNTDTTRFCAGSEKSRRKRGAGRDYGEGVHGDDKPFDPAPFLGFKNVLMWGYNHFSERLPAGGCLVWIKRNDDAFGSFLSDAELAWVSGSKGVFCKRGPFPQASAHERYHPTQKPVELMKWCIERYDEDVLVDPFMGSGTTLVACKELNRNGIGIEINEKYCEIAKKRLKATCKPLFTDVSGARNSSTKENGQNDTQLFAV